MHKIHFEYGWDEVYPYQIAAHSEDACREWITDTVKSLDDWLGVDMEEVVIYKRGELLIQGKNGYILAKDSSGEYIQVKV